MWFVIGAVIVGAAIIFIANGSIPDIFANISSSFQSSANDAIDTVDDIHMLYGNTEFLGESSQNGVPSFDNAVPIEGVEEVVVGSNVVKLPDPLREVLDYKDKLYLDKSDNLWKIERNVGVVTLTGDSKFHVYKRNDIHPGDDHTPFTISNAMPDALKINEMKILSDRFDVVFEYENGQVDNPVGVEYIRNSDARYSAYIIFTIRNDRLDSLDVAGARKWLNNNPILIHYVKNPTVETLDESLQDKLNNL